MNSKNGGMPSINLAASPNIDQAELSRQMAEMKAEMGKYKAEITSLRQELTTTQSLSTLQPTSRRRLLKQMAAGAAGLGAFAFIAGSAQNAKAETASDNAVEATAGANGYGAKLTGGLAPLMLVPGGSAGAPTAGSHSAGELYADSAGSLFYCYTSGTPGSWKQLAGAGSAPGLNVLSQPRRVINTLGANGPAILVGTANARTFTVGGTTFVPITAKAVFGNVVAYKGDASFGNLGGGFLGIYPAGGSSGGTATLSWNSTQATPINHFVSGLNASGQLSVLLNQEASGSAHVTLDIVGYYS